MNDGREAVLHLVAVVPVFGRTDQALVHAVEVLHVADFAVELQRRLFLHGMLVRDGQVRIGCTGDFLVGNRLFAGGALEDVFQFAFCILGFALDHPGVHPLPWKGVLNKYDEGPSFCFLPSYAFASKCNILNVKC